MKSESVGIFHWWPTSPLNLYGIYSRPLPSDSPWEPASEMTPSDPCLLVAMPCVVFFHSELGWLMHLTEYYGNGRMWLPRRGHQSHCPPIFSCWITRSGENQLPCREDTPRDLCGKELSPSAKSQVSKIFWKWILHCQPSLQMTRVTASIFTATSWKILSQKNPAMLLPGS